MRRLPFRLHPSAPPAADRPTLPMHARAPTTVKAGELSLRNRPEAVAHRRPTARLLVDRRSSRLAVIASGVIHPSGLRRVAGRSSVQGGSLGPTFRLIAFRETSRPYFGGIGCSPVKNSADPAWPGRLICRDCDRMFGIDHVAARNAKRPTHQRDRFRRDAATRSEVPTSLLLVQSSNRRPIARPAVGGFRSACVSSHATDTRRRCWSGRVATVCRRRRRTAASMT